MGDSGLALLAVKKKKKQSRHSCGRDNTFFCSLFDDWIMSSTPLLLAPTSKLSVIGTNFRLAVLFLLNDEEECVQQRSTNNMGKALVENPLFLPQ
jgi:hypothetical protein